MLALANRVRRYEDEKQGHINKSLEIVDGRLNEEDLPLDDDSAEKALLDNREALISSAEARIDSLNRQIDLSVNSCEAGVKYAKGQKYGITILKCEGISPGMFKIYID